MKGFIYKYTFPDGKVYIGQTRRNPQKRYEEHIDPVLGPLNSGFWEAYQKFKDFKYEVIETVENDNIDLLVMQLNRLESIHILESKATDPRYGYNKKTFGTVPSGYKAILDKEFTKIWTAIAQEELPFFHAAIAKVFDTHEPLTDAEREFIQSLIDESEFCDGIDLENLDNNDEDALFWLDEEFEFFLSQYQDARWAEINQYLSENASRILAESRDGKLILQIDSEGKVIRVFQSMAEIGQELNLVRTDNIYNVLRGKQKTAYGYRWIYKKDYTG